MSWLDQLLHQLANPAELPWKDETYDLGLASSLTEADRAVFVDKLIEQARSGDGRAILTLGHLQAGEALPMLQAAAASSDPWAPTARRALVLLGRGADVVQAIARDAVHAPAKMTRVAAVLDLAKIGGPIAIAGLREALADPDSAVRMLVWDGLVEALGLLPLIRNPQGVRELTSPIELWRILLASDLAAFVRIGVAEMRALIDQLTAGASPASLGIAWTPNPAPDVSAALRLALVDPDIAFPVDQIAQLTGHARRKAEALIALRLDQDDPDPRAPGALVALAARWTAPALAEVARSTTISPELRDELTASIRALQAA